MTKCDNREEENDLNDLNQVIIMMFDDAVNEHVDEPYNMYLDGRRLFLLV